MVCMEHLSGPPAQPTGSDEAGMAAEGQAGGCSEASMVRQVWLQAWWTGWQGGGGSMWMGGALSAAISRSGPLVN